jgi:hypothetical protein
MMPQKRDVEVMEVVSFELAQAHPMEVLTAECLPLAQLPSQIQTHQRLAPGWQDSSITDTRSV